MVKILVDYSNGHTEQLNVLAEQLNASYQGMPILFQVSWNTGKGEGLGLWIDFEFKGERGFLSLDDYNYPASQIVTDWPDIKRSLDIELGIYVAPEPKKYVVATDYSTSVRWNVSYHSVPIGWASSPIGLSEAEMLEAKKRIEEAVHASLWKSIFNGGA